MDKHVRKVVVCRPVSLFFALPLPFFRFFKDIPPALGL